MGMLDKFFKSSKSETLVNDSEINNNTDNRKDAKRCTPAILAMLETSGMTETEKIKYLTTHYKIDSDKAKELLTPKPLLNHKNEIVTP